MRHGLVAHAPVPQAWLQFLRELHFNEVGGD